jgi:hypothetical protein
MGGTPRHRSCSALVRPDRNRQAGSIIRTEGQRNVHHGWRDAGRLLISAATLLHGLSPKNCAACRKVEGRHGGQSGRREITVCWRLIDLAQ